jgi:ATP-dependent helicase/DNAse subunit B
MPLKLVTGPANSAKAAELLGGVRAALEREPLLVVPTAADVDRYRRELAEDGVVFGARVVRFAELVDEAARRAGETGRPLGATARARVVAAVAARARLDVLAASRATPGFARALARLFAELEVARVDPGRLAVGVRAWAEGDAPRRAYGDELAALYRGYRGALERLGRRDAELHALAVLDALRLAPGAWGGTPVFFYGFDDLTPLQRDAVETLAKHVDADVTVSLSYEAGRRAFAGRAATFEELRPLADEIVALDPLAEHYAPAARAPLHGLERALFEEEGAAGALDPAGAVALLEAGGERAEMELVGAEVRRLLDAGVPAEEIAVVVRSPEDAGPLVERVLAEFGVPFALRRRVPFSHLAAGRGLLALLRCATGGGTAEDAVAYLRTPGVVRHASLVDRLEARVRRRGIATAEDALAVWADDGRHLPAAIERVRVAAQAGPAALCPRLATELNRLLVADPAAPAPPRFEEGEEIPSGPVPVPPAPRLAADARAEAEAVSAGRRALEELGELAVADPALAGSAADVAEALGGVEVVVGEDAGPGRVSIADPLALRARRVRALVLCGLQEGAFPRPSRGEAFLGDEERRELAVASGIRLPFEADGGLGAERYLFYATVSRPEERLVLGFHTAGDDGDPAVPSFFLDDVRDLFAPALWERRARRQLGAVAWPGEPPTPRAGARAAAAAGPPRRPAPLAPLRSEAALRALRERPAWSASSLEAWNKCPVRWFVERYLNAEDLEADPEPMVRGSVAHETLEVTLRGLREATGSARLRPDRLAAARERMRAALREAAERVQISPNPERLAAGVRRLEADLDRYLETAAHNGSTYEPTWFEVAFGFEGEDVESLPPLELAAPDGPLRLRGRIDRIDVSPQGDRAVIVDYKGRRVTQGGRWIDDGSFQAALYLRAARDLLGLAPAGALYQPLGSGDARPRGLVVEDTDPGLDLVSTDRRDEEQVEEILTTVIDLATAAAAEARAGALEPRPETCTPQKACAYPGLCRCEAS